MSHLRNSEIAPAQLQAAITNLGQGTDKAGELGVLRVLIAHPATFSKEALNTAQVLDPIATVNLAALVEKFSEGSALRSLQLVLEAAAKKKKTGTRRRAGGKLIHTSEPRPRCGVRTGDRRIEN
jgi:hypothetical protein